MANLLVVHSVDGSGGAWTALHARPPTRVLRRCRGGCAGPDAGRELPGRAARAAAPGARPVDPGLRASPASSTTSATRRPGDRTELLERRARRGARAARRRGVARWRRCASLAPVLAAGVPGAAVPRPRRGQPAWTSASAGTRPSTTCSATARCPPLRSGGSCCTWPARPRPPTSPTPTRSVPRLQVLEHCQDVGEDARAGRVYLPAARPARRRPARRRSARGADR